jgi:hypothetical protein
MLSEGKEEENEYMNRHERRRAKATRTISVPLNGIYTMADVVLYPEESTGGVTVCANERGRDAVHKVLPGLERSTWIDHGYGLAIDPDGHLRLEKGDPSWKNVPFDFKKIPHMNIPMLARNYGHNFVPINKEIAKRRRDATSSWEEILSDATPQGLACLLAMSINREAPTVRAMTFDIADDLDATRPPKLALFEAAQH